MLDYEIGYEDDIQGYEDWEAMATYEKDREFEAAMELLAEDVPYLSDYEEEQEIRRNETLRRERGYKGLYEEVVREEIEELEYAE